MHHLKPTLKVLTQEQIEKVHHDALVILEQTGIAVDDPAAISLFRKAVGQPGADEHIKIPGDLVEWAITTAPSEIQIFDRLGSPYFTLTGDSDRDAVFGIGVTNLNYQDPSSREILPFHRNHMALAAGLGHNLDGFDFISTPGVIQDLPPETADLYGVSEMVANTTKPIVY